MKRQTYMMVRATEEEKLIAKAKAEEMGMGMSAFIRFLVHHWNRPETPQNKNTGVFIQRVRDCTRRLIKGG